MSSLLDESAVAENLEVDQAAADGNAPKYQYGAEQVEPGVLAGAGMSCHGNLVAGRSSLVVRRYQFVVSRWSFAPPSLCHPERSMSMSAANRHAESKDPSHGSSRGCLERSFHHDLHTSTSDKCGGPLTDRPPPRCSRASLGPSGSKTRTHTILPTYLLPRDHRHWRNACHHWALTVGDGAVHADHLSRFRRDQSHAPRQQINPFGIA